MCLGPDAGGQPRRSADRAASHASGASGGEVQRLPKDWANSLTWLPIVKLTVTYSF